MKTKSILALLFCAGIYPGNVLDAQTMTKTEISFQIPGIYNQDRHPETRTPISLAHLPQACFDTADDCLLFVGRASLDNALMVITDNTDAPVFTGLLTLAAEEKKTVDLLTLEAGNYTLHLYIGDREFVGTFEN